MIIPYAALSEPQKAKVRALRLAAGYTYRKPLCKAFKIFMSVDETFYHNKLNHHVEL